MYLGQFLPSDALGLREGGGIVQQIFDMATPLCTVMHLRIEEYSYVLPHH